MSGDIYVSNRVADQVLHQLVNGGGDPSGSPVDRLSDRELEVIQLIGRGLATQSNVLPKMISNIKEVRARGAMVICITTKDAVMEDNLCDAKIEIPTTADIFAPFTAAVVLQLIAYYTSAARGLDVDQPRNLAKSVTVE
jgi:glucosamine 6-phosphate synthetase-like amidotransferase/phosphosugar isomerase protein